jgi:DNA polymerase-4
MRRADPASILHADLDAFYASVEQLLDPRLRGRPVAVGGGVVLAASYEARAFGVQAGMPGGVARRMCPTLLFVGGHFDEYQRLSDHVIGVFRDFTPLVERISIDEAFLDVRGAVHLFGSPPDIAAAIRRRVRDEIGLAISVGVARTKHLAKIASQVAKPDGLVVVDPARERDFLDPLPVGLIWGVGAVTRHRLAQIGIHTVGELAAAPATALQHLLGSAAGANLIKRAENVDPRRVDGPRRASSVGAQAAFGPRRVSTDFLRATLGYLADRVAGRLRTSGRAGRTVTVRVRFADFRSLTRSRTIPAAISATLTVAEIATDLAGTALRDQHHRQQVSLLGISMSNLVDEAGFQLALPVGPGDHPGRLGRPGEWTAAARWASDRSVDAIRARFGRGAVGYATVMFSEVSRVPEAFRELAERHDPDR